MRSVIGIAAVTAALGIAAAFGASHDSQPQAATSADKAVLAQLKGIRKELQKNNTQLKENNSQLTQVNRAIGIGSFDRDTVRGLLKATCDAVGMPVYCH